MKRDGRQKRVVVIPFCLLLAFSDSNCPTTVDGFVLPSSSTYIPFTKKSIKSLDFIIPFNNKNKNGIRTTLGRQHHNNVNNNSGLLYKMTCCRMSDDNDTNLQGEEEEQNSKEELIEDSTSKKKMLGFAIPALGIYLCNPLLSNIDNAFVGQTVGTEGLAALSPATLCTDLFLYLFSFLSRATTGLVSQAYGTTKNTKAARDAGGPPLTVSIICGIFLSIFYLLFTPKMLNIINVRKTIQPAAASYIYWRGIIAWAALAQNVSLSILMATRDAITPLKIILLAAIVNIIGDTILCVYPLRLGCTGAAIATSFATLYSSIFMLKALKTKQILPTKIFKLPTKKQCLDLLEFTGPLLAITITRLYGFVNMQRTAMKLGIQHVAAYQLCFNVVVFFLYFGEPLSQLSQTKLPALLDTISFNNNNGNNSNNNNNKSKNKNKNNNKIISSSSSPPNTTIRKKHDNNDNNTTTNASIITMTLKSVLLLGVWTSLIMGAVAGGTVFFGSGLFSSDEVVISMAKSAAPSVFLAVATAIFSVSFDGAMLASRDFGFMLTCAIVNVLIQLKLLQSSWCTSISVIFTTFTLRLGTYALLGLLRMALGGGTLGRVINLRRQQLIN